MCEMSKKKKERNLKCARLYFYNHFAGPLFSKFNLIQSR